ncbi:MAG: helix-turn-helix domain-containing protein [Treponema sp.]|nr:helix-turn-helix domain-containing protein [Treponema sp.]
MYESTEFNISTIQPFMALNSVRFNEHAQGTMGISHFYSFRTDSDKDTEITQLPDSCSYFIFEYRQKKCSSFVIGNSAARRTFTAEKNAVHFIVRFLPGENPCFEKINPRELAERKEELENFSFMHSLVKKMAVQSTFEDRISTFLSESRKLREAQVSSGRLLFRQIIQLILSKKGILRISELEKLTGYSARYINHIFESQTGMSAKQFCNIVKLQFIIKELSEENVQFFSKLSQAYRFYDQAHFIHEFKNFTGLTPGEYMNVIKNSPSMTA